MMGLLVESGKLIIVSSYDELRQMALDEESL